MTGLIDTNVVLYVLLKREPFFAGSEAVWQACDDGRFEGDVSAVSLTTVFYVGRKLRGAAEARRAVGTCLRAFQVSPVYRETLEAALRMRGPDFEDDVQIACAQTSPLDLVVTRNPADFAASPIPVVTPAELLARQPARPGPP